MVIIFRGKNPLLIIALFLYGILLRLPYFNNPIVPELNKDQSVLFQKLLTWLTEAAAGSPKVFPFIIYFILFTHAVAINYVVNKQRLLNKQNYLPGMAYLLITALLPEWNVFSPELLSTTLILWIWMGTTNLYHSQRAKTILFNIGMVLGLSALLYFQSIVFIGLILLALIISRPFKLAEFIVGILGVVTPIYLLFVYMYVTDDWTMADIWERLDFRLPLLRTESKYIGSLGLYVFPFLLGGLFLQKNMGRMLIQTRKTWNILLVYLLLSVVLIFISTSNSFSEWLFMAVPLAAFHGANYSFPERNWYTSLIHWMTVGYLIFTQYFA